jgi:asparagine synthase (glutamine-hydrolysing)
VARDRIGVKPLHYAVLPDGMFVFGSELKSIMSVPGLSREIDPRAVEEYFAYGYVPEPRTIFKQAHKAAAGPHHDPEGRQQPRPSRKNTGTCRSRRTTA